MIDNNRLGEIPTQRTYHMKIALATDEPSLDREMAVRFGRGRFILFIDSENRQIQVIPNPYLNFRGGVCKELAQWVAAEQAQLALAVYWAPQDQQILSSVGIQVQAVCDESVKDIVGRI